MIILYFVENYKKFRLFIVFTFFSWNYFLFGKTLNDAQLLKSDNWIYKALATLSLETKESIFLDTKPISVGEIKFYLSQIDFENLSESGKILYQKVDEYLFSTYHLGKKTVFNLFPKNSATKIWFGTKLNPELYLKSNKNIPSTTNYFYHDNPLTIPIMMGFSQNIALELDIFWGKDLESSLDRNSFTNIPLNDSQREYEYPKYAYGNIAKNFKNWGISATIGKEGFSIGETKLGSVIYNSTFETDCYSVLSAYSSNLKYNLIFSQVDSSKFLFLHNFNLKILPNLKIGFTEGGLKHGAVELRFLNPTMILHSFYSASDYSRFDNNQYNLGNHYCSYMGITVDFYPIKNLRLYALWAQTELQIGGELESVYGQLLPNGYGLQVGVDYSIPANKKEFINLNIEGLYTTPYLYVKQSPDWSMVKTEQKQGQSIDAASWLGSPFGPDTFALTCSFEYENPQKWSFGFENLFLMKGEIDINTILKTKTIQDENGTNSYPSYYPSCAYYLGVLSEEDAIYKARKKGLSGIIQYRNDISLLGEYHFFPNFKVSANGTYTLIFNKNHKKGDFQQGFELKLACTFNIF